MTRLFSLDHALEALAAILATGAALGVVQSFVFGKHFVIPTLFLLLATWLGNLARFGLQGQRWAKHVLFWTFTVMTTHAFFALFWAADARPGALFGAAFYPTYGGFLLVVGGLCAVYARRNRLFG